MGTKLASATYTIRKRYTRVWLKSALGKSIVYADDIAVFTIDRKSLQAQLDIYVFNKMESDNKCE